MFEESHKTQAIVSDCPELDRLTQLRADVIKLLEDSEQLSQIKATLVANFGAASGRKQWGLAIDESQSALQMMIQVLETLGHQHAQV